MEFLAFECIRISRKWNISAALEQWQLELVQSKCIMGCQGEPYNRFLAREIVILRRYLVWSSIYLGSSFPNDLLLITEEPDVVRIVESSIPKKKLASMKSMLESSLTDLKRSHADTADSYLKEIKKLKFDEPHRFKKQGNEDQYRRRY